MNKAVILLSKGPELINALILLTQHFMLKPSVSLFFTGLKLTCTAEFHIGSMTGGRHKAGHNVSLTTCLRQSALSLLPCLAVLKLM